MTNHIALISYENRITKMYPHLTVLNLRAGETSGCSYGHYKQEMLNHDYLITDIRIGGYSVGHVNNLINIMAVFTESMNIWCTHVWTIIIGITLDSNRHD